eukprot:scaffold9439_cov115-Cylindrotheca_fusiformis.AAC.13
MFTNEVVRAASGASQKEDLSVLACTQKQTSTFQCACQSHGVSCMCDPGGRESRSRIARAQVILRERKGLSGGCALKSRKDVGIESIKKLAIEKQNHTKRSGYRTDH